MPRLVASASLAALLAVSAPAQAGTNGGAVLLGFGYDGARGGDPETMRLGIRGQLPVTESKGAGMAVVLPLGLSSSGESGLGWTTERTAVEFAPSARLLIAPESVVRGYADAGIGFVWRFSETDTWFGDGTERRFGPMTRTAIGLEIGGTDAGQVAFVAEPFSFQRYGFDSGGTNRFSSMFGIASRF